MNSIEYLSEFKSNFYENTINIKFFINFWLYQQSNKHWTVTSISSCLFYHNHAVKNQLFIAMSQKPDWSENIFVSTMFILQIIDHISLTYIYITFVLLYKIWSYDFCFAVFCTPVDAILNKQLIIYSFFFH